MTKFVNVYYTADLLYVYLNCDDQKNKQTNTQKSRRGKVLMISSKESVDIRKDDTCDIWAVVFNFKIYYYTKVFVQVLLTRKW